MSHKTMRTIIFVFLLLLCIQISFSFTFNPSKLIVSKLMAEYERDSTRINNNNNNNGGKKVWNNKSNFRRSDNIQRRSRRNDPWWMRDEEANNPRILPKYEPWWLNPQNVDDSWTVSELKGEAKRRGILGYTKMKKDELIQLLQKLSSDYTLSNEGFKGATFTNVARNVEVLSCYPENYEGGLEAVEKMRQLQLKVKPKE